MPNQLIQFKVTLPLFSRKLGWTEDRVFSYQELVCRLDEIVERDNLIDLKDESLLDFSKDAEWLAVVGQPLPDVGPGYDRIHFVLYCRPHIQEVKPCSYRLTSSPEIRFFRPQYRRYEQFTGKKASQWETTHRKRR